MSSLRRHAPDLLIALLIGLLAWTLRAASATAFVTWDEPAWVYRSVHFAQALSDGRWADTLLTGHPGVTTMWSGALSLLWHRYVTGAVSQGMLLRVAALPTLEVHDPQAMRWLVSLLPRAKDGILLAHALLIMAIYGLTRRLVARRYAVVVAAMLALDPYLLGLSRVLHIDALASGLMLVSVLAMVVYSREGRGRYLVASAVAASLAVLTKSYGLVAFLAALAILMICRAGGQRVGAGFRRRTWLLLRDAATWSAVAAAVFVLLWPAMWTVPSQALRAVIGLSLEYASAPGDATVAFFRGAVVEDVGPFFYPTVIWFRTMPLVPMGVALALTTLVLQRQTQDQDTRARGRVILATLLLGLVHLLVISLSQKKYDRYVLPTLLAFDVIAAVGWVSALELLAGRARWKGMSTSPRVVGAAALALVGLQAAVLALPWFPSYYLAYFNPLAGGLRGAARTLPVGWGEGVEQVTSYLTAKKDAPALTVATWAVAGLAPSFPGEMVKPTLENLSLADYVLLYIGDVQNETELAQRFHRAQEPEFVAHVGGIEYAWLYPNTYWDDLGPRIDHAAGDADLIMLSSPSAFERHYEGLLPMVALEGESEAAAAQALALTVPGAEHVFYVEYAGDVQRKALSRRLLAQNALLLWEEPFSYGTLFCYRTLERAHYRPTSPDQPTSLRFGDALRLEAYGLSSPVVEYRQSLGVGLEWRALQPVSADYHLFMHLIDAKGRKWGQQDTPLYSRAGSRTSDWVVGSTYTSIENLPLDPGIPPGQYRVALGLYRIEDLERLPIQGIAGQDVATEFLVGPVQVLPATAPPTAEELSPPRATSLRLADQVEVIGYALSSDQPLSGDVLSISLYWRCLAPIADAYQLALELSRNGQTLTSLRATPVGDGYSTSQWRPGDVLRYAHDLPLPVDLASGRYDLTVNLVGVDGQTLAPEPAILTYVDVEHRERLFEAPAISSPSRWSLGESIVLLGYDLTMSAYKPGDTVQLTLYWQAKTRPDADYVVFTHLLDPSQSVRGQRDSVPVRGQRPTTGWAEGEVVVDRYDIPIDPAAAPGDYRLEVGMYDPQTGERLAVASPSGETISERRVLLDQPLRVTP